MQEPAIRVARHDAGMAARIVARWPLRYGDGGDRAEDRPAHARAGSALAQVQGALWVVQDDANFVARVEIVDGAPRVMAALALPRGAGGLRQFDDARGNKADKLDLEACFVAPGELLIALGSGSTARRERVAVVPLPAGAEPRLVALPRWYAALRARVDFAGSELNVEGAVLDGDALLLFQRGNGSPRDGVAPVDATARVSLAALLALIDDPDGAPVPALDDVRRYDLGAVDGRRLTFTDAARVGDALVYLAAAEDSPDVTRDGPVAGVAIGVLDGDAPRYTLLRDERGELATDKAEGLAAHPAAAGRLFAVVDRDDPATPAELLEIALG